MYVATLSPPDSYPQGRDRHKNAPAELTVSVEFIPLRYRSHYVSVSKVKRRFQQFHDREEMPPHAKDTDSRIHGSNRSWTTLCGRKGTARARHVNWSVIDNN